MKAETKWSYFMCFTLSIEGKRKEDKVSIKLSPIPKIDFVYLGRISTFSNVNQFGQIGMENYSG